MVKYFKIESERQGSRKPERETSVKFMIYR